MGFGIYPVFNPKVPDAVFGVDGKLLAQYSVVLDRIARDNGMPAFSSFGDNRPVPDRFNGDPDELSEALGPWNEWFLVGDGLRVVEGLLAAIGSGAAGFRSSQDSAEVATQLRELAACLSMAMLCGARFRLEMG
jgi:hypothetical protein